MNDVRRIAPLLLLGCLLLLASWTWAYQDVSKSANIDLIQNLVAKVYMNTSISLNARMALANDTSGAGPAIIFLPRNITNDQDLNSAAGPNGSGIYMCPGQLKVLINQSSTWADGRYYSTANYGPPPPPTGNRPCPNILLNQCGNQCNVPCGWSQGSGASVQWMDDSAFFSRMRSSIIRIINQQTQTADYDRICTPLQSKSDYYTVLTSPPPPPQYPGQESQSGLICSGSEWVTVDSNPMTRPADSAVSPGPISSTACNPTTGDVWVTGNLAVGTHNVRSILGSQQCLGFVHIFPDVANTAQNWKNIYRDNTNGVPAVAQNTTPANWTVFVVDPRTCSVNASADPIMITPLDGASYQISINISNSGGFFDMVADDVGIASAPEPGWSANKAPAPNGFAPDIIPAGGYAILKVSLTAPDPVLVKEGCVDIIVSLHSAQPMCNRQSCLTNVTVKVCFNEGDDLVSAISADASVDLGKTITIEAITYNNGSRPTPIATNTSVSITGQPVQYFRVPALLPPTSFPSATDPQKPDPPYADNTNPHLYLYTCNFPHIVQVTVYSDWVAGLPNGALMEINEKNNVFTRFIFCGRTLLCPDYT